MCVCGLLQRKSYLENLGIKSSNAAFFKQVDGSSVIVWGLEVETMVKEREKATYFKF